MEKLKQKKIWGQLNLGTTANKQLDSELKFVYSENGTLSVIFQNNDLLLGVVGENFSWMVVKSLVR